MRVPCFISFLMFMSEPKIFYRVGNLETSQGLWYDTQGIFTGLIHNEFNFCKNNELKMDFDPELVGWLSATDTTTHLFEWFPREDIINLQKQGWFIHVYEAVDYKFYERFQHLIIKQETSKFLATIPL